MRSFKLTTVAVVLCCLVSFFAQGSTSLARVARRSVRIHQTLPRNLKRRPKKSKKTKKKKTVARVSSAKTASAPKASSTSTAPAGVAARPTTTTTTQTVTAAASSQPVTTTTIQQPMSASQATIVSNSTQAPSGTTAGPTSGETLSTSSSGSSPAPGSVLFDGSQPSSWLNQSAASNRVQVLPDPDGASDSALQFTARNSDVAPLTPTDNPRAQLVSPTNILAEGEQFWESYEIYLPSSFPTAETYNGWLALGSPFYGPPWNGSPSVELGIVNGQWRWATNAYAPVPYTIIWQQPIVLGEWVRFTWHIIPSANGFAELYVNGQPLVVSYNGQTGEGVNLPVIDTTDYEGPWASQLSVYYSLNTFAAVTIYFKNFKIGTSQAAAEG